MVVATKPLPNITKKNPAKIPAWYLSERVYPKLRTIEAVEIVFGPGLNEAATVKANRAGILMVEMMSVKLRQLLANRWFLALNRCVGTKYEKRRLEM